MIVNLFRITLRVHFIPSGRRTDLQQIVKLSWILPVCSVFELSWCGFFQAI